MTAKEAVAARIKELCKERGVAVNAVANNAGISPSTIYSAIGPKSQNPGVATLHEICDGFGISLREFFNSDLFDELDRINL